jgi:hypothetical protein
MMRIALGGGHGWVILFCCIAAGAAGTSRHLA